MASNVYAGLSKHLKLDHFSEAERRIIRQLGNDFYVTNGGKSISVGNSVYRYCLIKFPDNFKHLFRAESELIVLFSSYDNFEVRTLEALDKIIKESNSLRLDKICAFVISRDHAFPQKLAEIAKANKEMWTVVPFVYSEFDEPATTSFFQGENFDSFFLTGPI